MLLPWQRIATLDSRTPRCESMNVSAALSLAGSSVSRRFPTPRITSRRGASGWVELDVRIHHFRVLPAQPVAHARKKVFRFACWDVIPHRNASEHEELV